MPVNTEIDQPAHLQAAQLHSQAAEAFQCENWQSAAEFLEKAVALLPGRAEWQYMLGCAHEKLGNYRQAAESYSAALSRESGNASWHFSLGGAYAAQFLWADAAVSYENALRLAPKKAEYLFQMGLMLEKQQLWEQSGGFYAKALKRADSVSAQDCLFRLGFVLWQGGRYEEVCALFLRSWQDVRKKSLASAGAKEAAKPTKAVVYWQDIAVRHTKGKRWEEAAMAWQHVADRDHQQRPEVFYCIGEAWAKNRDYKKAADAFMRTYPAPLASIIERKTVLSGLEKDKANLYCEFCNSLPLAPKTILYNPFCKRPVDSPGALFTYLLDHPDYQDFVHVLAVDKVGIYPDSLVRHPRVVFVKHGSALYFRYLATAGYVIHNAKFSYTFTCRPGQKYLNTWHGTPLKHVGRHVHSSFAGFYKVARNFLQATHFITPNPFTTGVLLDAYGVEQQYDGLLCETGYPRVDTLVNATEESKENLRKRLGIPQGKKTIMYAPTWRSDEEAAALFTTETFGAVWEKITRMDNVVLIFRGHNRQNAILRESSLPVIVADQEYDACELMSVVDILITDYSSVFFDFYSTRRPVIYYAPDYDTYCKKQGLYFAYEELPGALCKTVDELHDAVRVFLQAPYVPDALHLDAIAQFNTHDDGHASQRTVQFFIHDQGKEIRDNKNRAYPLCFAGDLRPGKLTETLCALMDASAARAQDTALVTAPGSLNPQGRKLLKQHLRDWNLAAREGDMLCSAEQQWLLGSTHLAGESLDGPMHACIRGAFQREFTRLFGPASAVHGLLLLEASDSYWLRLFGMQDKKYGPKILCLAHADDQGPNISDEALCLYALFDRLVMLPGFDCNAIKERLLRNTIVSPEKIVEVGHTDELFALLGHATENA